MKEFPGIFMQAVIFWFFFIKEKEHSKKKHGKQIG